ncbi:MAG: hypothetical protein WBA16_03685 [Nonlabens sp.]
MTYTKRAFHFSVISLVLLLVFAVLMTIERSESNAGMDQVTGYLIILFLVSTAVGFFFSLLSIREPHRFKKYFAMTVNFILALLTCVKLFNQYT